MENYYNQASQNTQNYTPVQFSNLAYNYNLADTTYKLQSAIVVVKHDLANDSSHVKNITVEIIGDDGQTKTFEFTVEVCQ